MRKAFGVALLVGIACGAPSRPGEIGSEYVPLTDAGPDAGPLVLAPTVAKSDDPTTCAQAASERSYVGCDYWPTVVANTVWSIFDFAVVVANAGVAPADVTVTGPGGVTQSQTVASNGLAKFYLPWVPSLKGPDSDVCGEALPLQASVYAAGGAYHLVSSVPVTVYQFNALEYAPMGGPPGKNWEQCPGAQTCDSNGSLGCFSFTNDSSLLLPSTAMTGHYRVTGYPGATAFSNGASVDTMGGYFAITATVDGTHVKVALPQGGHVLASQDSLGLIPDTLGGGELNLSLDAGDVAEVVGAPGETVDLSGALVAADQPVQVIAGTPCSEVPTGVLACDHLEQSVFPAETLGKQYIVAAPTGPSKAAVGRDVRFYGNVDGTVLTFSPSMPPGCQFPAVALADDGGTEGGDDGGVEGGVVATGPVINAGQVVDCGIVTGDFEVTGTSEFSVGSFMQGGSVVDPNGILGDPSESLIASVEQFRTKYVFLAPTDYSENFVDVVAPVGAVVVLDGAALKTTAAQGAVAGFTVVRVSLNGINVGSGGAHVLTASAPIGAQVLGYGSYTSYQYPAGLNLKQIAPPPPNPP